MPRAGSFMQKTAPSATTLMSQARASCKDRTDGVTLHRDRCLIPLCHKVNDSVLHRDSTVPCGGSHKVRNVCASSRKTIAPCAGTGVPRSVRALGSRRHDHQAISTDAEQLRVGISLLMLMRRSISL